jgi:hypothetical protein
LEGGHIFTKIIARTAHLPTFLLIAGYPAYWVELFVLRQTDGITSPLALVLFCVIFGAHLLFTKEPAISGQLAVEVPPRPRALGFRFLMLAGIGVLAGFFLISAWAAVYPPHLSQEYDVLNYHIPIPRQHLVRGAFDHLSWSSADVMLLPVDYALAPYWFLTELPNKIPQYFFLTGLFAVALRVTGYFSKGSAVSALLVAFAIAGSHNVGIQAGTAMLDIAMAYLFLAAVDSFLRGNTVLFVVESAFYIWSKGFIPVQMVLIGLGLCVIYRICRVFGVRDVVLDFGDRVDFSKFAGWLSLKKRRVLLAALLVNIVIGGPFLWRALVYAGTPLYPFGIGAVTISDAVDRSSPHWVSLKKSADFYMTHVKDGYGEGRSPVAFVKHLWMVAVPDKGVNNKFDYPLGLPYLLVLLPFFYFLFRSFREKKFSVLPLFAVLFWLLWWTGSQQTRFLYVPIILMYITTFSKMRQPPYIMMTALVIAVTFNGLSTFRAHKHVFGKSRHEVLREKDKDLVRLSRDYHEAGRRDIVDLEFHDVAFARFPARVTRERMPFALVP